MLTHCRYCGLDFSGFSPSQKGGHAKYCDKNPLKQSPWNKGKKNPYSEESQASRSEKVKRLHKNGHYKDSYSKMIDTKKRKGNLTHTDASKEKIRKGALASKHRRLKKYVVEYKGILLDSSWELALAKRLDEQKIEWIRPEPISWTDEDGISHNYFPDFYLIEYDLYLDPKNPHAIKVQEKKLKQLLTQHNNILIIDSLEKCETWSCSSTVERWSYKP